jgi:hypothetical protein
VAEPAAQAAVISSGESWRGAIGGRLDTSAGIGICAFSAEFHLIKISPEGAIPNKTEVAV